MKNAWNSLESWIDMESRVGVEYTDSRDNGGAPVEDSEWR